MKTFKSFINEASIAQDYVAPKDSDDEVKDIKPRSKGEDDFKKSHKMTHTKHPVAGDHQFDGSIKGIKEETELNESCGDECESKRDAWQSADERGMSSASTMKKAYQDCMDKCKQRNESVDEAVIKLKNKDIAFTDLEQIVKGKKSGQVKFNNGKMETVDAETAKLIVTTLNKLNPNNKKKAIATLNKDPNGFMKVLDIAHKA
ncbi:MAG: hypothetical protein H8D23_06650 [Candidatus Brocadiales bacterium]|nr:hypothetical protein [Candidatus Brocadiales bacterium]